MKTMGSGLGFISLEIDGRFALTKDFSDAMIQKIRKKGVNLMLNNIKKNNGYGRSFAPWVFV